MSIENITFIVIFMVGWLLADLTKKIRIKSFREIKDLWLDYRKWHKEVRMKYDDAYITYSPEGGAYLTILIEGRGVCTTKVRRDKYNCVHSVAREVVYAMRYEGMEQANGNILEVDPK